MHKVFLLIFLINCFPLIAAASENWKARQDEVITSLNAAFDKFKLKVQKDEFDVNQKAYDTFSKKNCDDLYKGFAGGSAMNTMVQACYERSIKARLAEIRNVYFQTWPSEINKKIDEWLKESCK